MKRLRIALLSFSLAALGTCVPASARAEPEPTTDSLPGGPAFRYVTPPEREYVRAVIEEITILGLGEAQYLFDQSSNQVDWDLAYDWPSFRSKLTFQSVAFDTNKQPTNWVTHPLAGWAYYSAARSNRLSITESFLFAVGSSTLWEYLGEYREQVSVNDQITTPLAGAISGEATMQLGAFFRRSRRTPLTTTLAWLFAAPKHIHDAIDGAVTETASELDEYGLPADEWHRFQLGAAGAVTVQDRLRAQVDQRIALSSSLIALSGYGRPGEAATVFDSGEVSTLGFDLAMSGEVLEDVRFSTSMMPAGVYYRNLDANRRGHDLLAGMITGFEYGLHRYDRDGRHPLDQIALVDAGVHVDHGWHAGPFVLRSTLDTLVDFGGVRSYALGRYLAGGGSPDDLPSVLAEQSYYHALGATLHPTVNVDFGALDVTADARIDFFSAIRALDRQRPSDASTLNARDRRVALRGAVGVSPAKWLHLSLAAEQRQRNGRIAGTTDSRGETSFVGAADFRF